jgi:Xaa-Pro aminopeptidase
VIMEKLAAIRKQISENNIDALLIENPVNRRYLSGFEGSSGVLLISRDKAYLVVDFRYLEQAANQAPDFEIVRRHEDLLPELAVLIEKAGWKRIGFEAKHTIYKDYVEMEEKLPAKMISLENGIEKLRIIKTDTEKKIMKQGAMLLDQAYDYLKTLIRSGMKESELALELEIYLLRHGASERSFRFIVASGFRGAMPHGTATDKIMEKGDLVTIDFGVVFNGYATDMTRTLSIGEPSQELRTIYELVYNAQKEAAAAIMPGRKANEIDAVARDIIKEAGYAEYFGHGLGHGVGLEVHEAPILNPQSDTVLEPGMVLTVEPGVYLPGKGGVRIEDMIYVTENGMELLTGSERELFIV